MVTQLTIRATQPEDLVLLSEYWYDQMALRQQTSAHLRLAPDASQRWLKSAHGWLRQEDVLALSAQGPSGDLMGAILVQVVPNTPGLLPDHTALVLALIIDIHAPQRQQGTGRHLLNALRERLKSQQITQLSVAVSVSAPVEQAFWRGMGAQSSDEIFWMSL